MLSRQVSRVARPLALRLARPATRAASPLQLRQPQRFSSSSSKPSPHASFYKTFGRPIAKVLLIAMLTYQIAYLLWLKLEAEETKTLRKAEIAELEDKVRELQNGKSS